MAHNKSYRGIALLSLLVLALLWVAAGAGAAERGRKPRLDNSKTNGNIEHRVKNDRQKDSREERTRPTERQTHRVEREARPAPDTPTRPQRKPVLKEENPNVKPGYVVKDTDWVIQNSSRKQRDVRRQRERDERAPRPVYQSSKLAHTVQVYKTRPRYQQRPPRYTYWSYTHYDPFYRRSVYYYYNYYPYVSGVRIRVLPYVSVNYYTDNINYYTGDYYLSSSPRTALDTALSDIRYAWINQRHELIDIHLGEVEPVAVLLDGVYDYSLDPDDYLRMTADAIYDMKTLSFTWDNVRKRTNGEFVATGKHRYRDNDGIDKTVFVSYTLRNVQGNYIIVEVGSSNRPLE